MPRPGRAHDGKAIGRWIAIAFGTALLWFLAATLTVWFGFQGCVSHDRSAEWRLRMCNLSLAASEVTPFDARPVGQLFERGLLRASLGLPGATDDFDRAIALATRGSSWTFSAKHAGPGQEGFATVEWRIGQQPAGSLGRCLWLEAVDRSDHPHRPPRPSQCTEGADIS